MFDALQPVVQDFLVTLCTGVLAILSGFLIALAKKGVDWVSEKIQTIQNENLRNEVNEALSKLENIVTTTVTSLQQSLGEDIKNSIAKGDGKYSQEDLLALKDQAIETIKKYLTSATTDILSVAYDDLDDLIGDMIEAAVHNLKTNKVASTKTTLLG